MISQSDQLPVGLTAQIEIAGSFFSAGTTFCRSKSICKIHKHKNPKNFHVTRCASAILGILSKLIDKIFGFPGEF